MTVYFLRPGIYINLFLHSTDLACILVHSRYSVDVYLSTKCMHQLVPPWVNHVSSLGPHSLSPHSHQHYLPGVFYMWSKYALSNQHGDGWKGYPCKLAAHLPRCHQRKPVTSSHWPDPWRWQKNCVIPERLRALAPVPEAEGIEMAQRLYWDVWGKSDARGHLGVRGRWECPCVSLVRSRQLCWQEDHLPATWWKATVWSGARAGEGGVGVMAMLFGHIHWLSVPKSG